MEHCRSHSQLWNGEMALVKGAFISAGGAYLPSLGPGCHTTKYHLPGHSSGRFMGLLSDIFFFLC
jgi:hypothetical protein